MSQKYKKSKKYGANRPKKKITFEDQVRHQGFIDREKEKVKKNKTERALRQSVWDDEFEIGGAL